MLIMKNASNKTSIVLLAIVALFLSSQVGVAEDSDWTQFLGPAGDSDAQNATPLTSWDESNHIWVTDIPGTGWSSPVYKDGHIWLTTATTKPATKEQIEKKKQGVQFANMKTTVGALDLYAICLDLESGKILHNIHLANIAEPDLINPLNSYASPTPAIDDGKVVCHFGNYGTWCLDAKTGSQIWNSKFDVDHSVGAGSSPVVHDGKVLLVCDGIDEQYIAAVSLSSGEELWKTERPDFRNPNGEQQKAYSTPLISKFDGKTQAIIPGAQWVIAYDPETGKEIWRVDHGDGFSVVPMATVESGLVIFASGYMKSEFAAVDPTGTGDVTKTHVKWRASQAPAMPSMISTGDKVYAVTDNGIMSCVDAKTGELVKRKRIGGNFAASPLLAGGNIYLSSREGNMTIVKCDPSLEEVGKQKFDSRLIATPAPVGNDLLIRTEKKLYRIGKKAG